MSRVNACSKGHSEIKCQAEALECHSGRCRNQASAVRGKKARRIVPAAVSAAAVNG